MKRAVFAIAGIVLLVILFWVVRGHRKSGPIKIGILHSRTGTMAISEQAVVDATLFAVDELNKRGGVLGREVQPVLADGASDPIRFRLEAQRLIEKSKVAVIFGCWTSASRKEVKEVVEQEKNLLVYPLQYEGVEESPAIIYTGAVPNQQIKPAVKWAMDNLGKRFYLIGSDYIFPRIANRMIRDLAALLGAEVVGERYLPMGKGDFAPIAEEIASLHPSVVFNTLNGDANIAFFGALQELGITAADIPVLSFSISETELPALSDRLPAGTMTGHYASWSYFETLPGEENQSFLRGFRNRYGSSRRVSAPMVAAFTGVRLWAQAVEDAQSADPAQVRRAFYRQSMYGPGGIIYIDDRNHHAWKPGRIGRITSSGEFEIVWDSQKPIRPEPYPAYAEPSHWQQLEEQLYQQWGNHWTAVPEAVP